MSDLQPTHIEQKKQDKNTGSQVGSQAGDFFTNLLSNLKNLCFVLLVGGIVLYGARVSQANILPTDYNCFPYTDVEPTIGKAIINTDIVKSKELGEISTKLIFPFDADHVNRNVQKEGFISYFKNLKQSKDSNTLYLYISTIIHSLLSVNISLFNTVYNMMNSNLTETIIIFLSPIVMLIMFMLLFFGNSFYLVYLFLYNTCLFYSTKTVDPSTEKASWEQKEADSMWTFGMFFFGNWWKSILIIIGVLFFLSTIGGFLLPILSMFAVLYSFLLPVFMEAELYNPDNPSKKTPYTFKTAFMNILKYKMNIIMYIISFIVISNAFSTLSIYAGVMAIIVCILLYFFKPQIYQPYVPKQIPSHHIGFSPSTQATRQCSIVPSEVEAKEGAPPQEESSNTTKEVDSSLEAQQEEGQDEEGQDEEGQDEKEPGEEGQGEKGKGEEGQGEEGQGEEGPSEQEAGEEKDNKEMDQEEVTPVMPVNKEPALDKNGGKRKTKKYRR
jgi:hypothetical protein